MIIALGFLILGIYMIFGPDRNVDSLIKEHVTNEKKNVPN